MNMDYFILGMGISAPLALHQGDLAAVGAAFNRAVDVVPRMLAEPNQAPETVVELLSNSQLWPYLLGKGEQMVGVIEECVGATWAAIDSWCDAYADDSDNNAYWAPRGQAGTGPWPLSMDSVNW